MKKMIRQAYFWHRYKETPPIRPIKVYWHVGDSGTGKSYTYIKLVEEKGEEAVYMYSDFENGGLDNYCGEPILFMDEFRGQIRFFYAYEGFTGLQTGLTCSIYKYFAFMDRSPHNKRSAS